MRSTCKEFEILFSKPSWSLSINPFKNSYHMNELLDYIPDITKQMFWLWVLLSCGFAETVTQLAHAANQHDVSLNRFYTKWIEINWRTRCLALHNTFRPLVYVKFVPYSSPYKGYLSFFLCWELMCGGRAYWPRPFRLEPSLFSISVCSYMPFPLCL